MGRLSKKDIKLQAKAILESKTLVEAYKKTHNCNDNTARSHCSDMLNNPQVMAELEKMLDTMKTIDVTKANIIKLYQSIILDYQADRNGVRASDVIRVLENLQKLVPEFVDRHVVENYENMTDEQLTKAIQDKIQRFNLN